MGMFNTIPRPKVKRSVFSSTISFENKLSFDFGMIVPILSIDLLPGDNFYYSPEVFIRCAPLIVPMMQMCDVHIDVFKAPVRLLMRDTPQIPGFETFMSPKDVFGEGVQPTMSQFELIFGDNITRNNIKYLQPGSLSDYLGVPTVDANLPELVYNGQTMRFRALDHIAYQWIYDEFYRKEDLQPNVMDEDYLFYGQHINDPDDLARLMELRYRNWTNDYFTSALPNTQRGIDVGIPITADVPISYRSPSAEDVADGKITKIYPVSGSSLSDLDPLLAGGPSSVSGDGHYIRTDVGTLAIDVDNSDRLIGHLSNVVATINDLRLSVALQSWAEASIRRSLKSVARF